jgi:predicted phosphoribosyltransferase
LQFLSTWSRIDSKGEKEIKVFVDKGPVKEVKEVGMGPVKEVGFREREADGRENVSKVQVIVVDHVINRGLTMAEAARLIHLNLKRSTVNSIMR